MNQAISQEIPQEIQQVLKGLALNRRPGWHFPGNFLELSFDEVGAEGARLSLNPGPHCIDADGQTNRGAVGLLADIALSAAIREHAGFAVRMATVSMTLQFTAAPRVGRLEARGGFDGFHQGASGRQGLARAEVYTDGQLLCTVSGSFMVLDRTEGLQQMPLWRNGAAEDPPMPALTADELTDDEQAVYQRACEAMAPGPAGFIERFWLAQPERREGGASCDYVNGPHIGNRVGHTQGGIVIALAMHTADAALGAGWRLVGLSSWYVRPGTGPVLHAQADILHQGGFTAVVQIRLLDAAGATVLMAMSNHSRTA